MKGQPMRVIQHGKRQQRSGPGRRGWRLAAVLLTCSVIALLQAIKAGTRPPGPLGLMSASVRKLSPKHP